MSVKCPGCGCESKALVKFCPECGGRMPGATAISAASHEEALSLGDLRTMQGAGSGKPVGEALSLGAMATMEKPAAGRDDSALKGLPLAVRYELLEEIGHGGFAQVWKARDRKLGRTVAVKRLKTAVLGGAEGKRTLERFAREAAAIAQLNHRNIVQVYDHDADAEGHYVVMELVEGGTLRDYLKSKQKGKLSEAEAVGIVKGIAQGLGCAHKKNLVHRDIKPSNVLLSFEGSEVVPKIVDFGLARMGSDSELSVSGYGMGTPYYMPPEQRRDAKSVNHTADIYALGKVLYELCSGELPDIVDPEKISPALAKIVLKCVKTKPEERYFSTDELVASLDGLGAHAGAAHAANAAAAADQHACPSCGRVNPESVRFCKSCGAGLVRKCPECADDIPIYEPFCGKCGTEVEGFLKAADIVERMRRHTAEKRWSRVLKEAEGVPPQLRLPGQKGGELLAAIAKLRAEASAGIAQSEAATAQSEKLLEGNRFQEALKSAEKALALDPNNETAAKQQARLVLMLQLLSERDACLAVADFEGAEAVVRQMKEHGLPDVSAAVMMKQTGDERKALQAVQDQVAEFCAALNFDSAGKAVERAMARWPQAAWPKKAKAQLAALMTLHAEREALMLAADFDQAQLAVEAMRQNGLPENAVKRLLDKIEEERGRLEHLVSEARRFVEEKRLDAAADAWTKIAGLWPDSKPFGAEMKRAVDARRIFLKHVASAQSLAALGRFKTARDEALKAMEMMPSAAGARAFLDSLSARQKRRRLVLQLSAVSVVAVALGWMGLRTNRMSANAGHVKAAEQLAMEGNVDAACVRAGKVSGCSWLLVSASAPLRGHYEALAVEGYRKAAEQGDAAAMYKLGLCHDRGAGVAQDKVAALKWYRASAAKGDKDAIRQMEEFYAKAKADYERTVASDLTLLQAHGGKLWTEVDRQARLGGASVNDPAAGSDAYAKALNGLPAAVAEAKAAEKSAQLKAALAEAQSAKAREDWAAVVAAADAALAIDAANAEAKRLKAEAEGNLAPTLTILTQTEDGRDVSAVVGDGRSTWKTSQAIPLEAGASYSFEVSVPSNSSNPSIPSKRHAPATLAVTADWRGPQTRRVTLKEIKGPAPGKPVEVPDLGMVLMPVAAGSFQMSSEYGSSDEKPVRTVRITRDFWMGKTEVTQAEYRQVTGKSPSSFKGDDLPVERVSWDDAVAFCEELTRRERAAGRLPQGYVYRLPTEAEWEYAARGGARSKGFLYAGGNEIDAVAWYYGNAGKTRLDDTSWSLEKLKENGNCTHPVGLKTANELGICDMSGNVWEWCSDWYQDSYGGLPDADSIGPSTGSLRVIRGGGWNDDASGCRSAFRFGDRPSVAYAALGFRMVLAPVP